MVSALDRFVFLTTRHVLAFLSVAIVFGSAEVSAAPINLALSGTATANGSQPGNTPAQGIDGNFYGTTSAGGDTADPATDNDD